MGINDSLGTRQSAAVDQRCMIQLIAED